MIRILQVEQQPQSFPAQKVLREGGIDCTVEFAATKDELQASLKGERFDLILWDGEMAGVEVREMLDGARERWPYVSLIGILSSADEKGASDLLRAGAAGCVLREHAWQLAAVARQELENRTLQHVNHGMARLVRTVQELSLARDLEGIQAIVRHAARELTGADGATFVLRDGEFCHYVDEEAIAPLWKGMRFPLEQCISGWAMLNRQPAVIEDIYKDSRIPADAYRPTFVKSLIMAPIRATAPIGAIGNYWAIKRQPTVEEVELLQALANTTAVAMEKVQVYKELEDRVKDRTAELQSANAGLKVAVAELDSFSHAVSHDLAAPLRGIAGFADMAVSKCGDSLNETGKRYLGRIQTNAEQMRQLIDDLLRLSRISRAEMRRENVDMSALAGEIVEQLKASAPERKVEVTIAENLTATGDRGLLRAALENLLSNAWKYSGRRDGAMICFGMENGATKPPAYFVRDNGAGFDMSTATKLFQPFQRMHSAEEFAGTGVGLSTVQRIIHRHGGRIWAESEKGRGATFRFTLQEQANQ